MQLEGVLSGKRPFPRFSCAIAVVFLFCFLFMNNGAEAATWTNGQAATTVLGQADFTTSAAGPTQTRLSMPTNVCIDPTTRDLWVAGYSRNRVLKWTAADKIISASAASVVLGQVNFTSSSSGTSESTFNAAIACVIDSSGNMYVADSSNNRILRFNSVASKATGASADGVLGQADFISGTANRGGAVAANTLSGPKGMATSSTGTLWVADFGNHRVLRYDNAATKANGASADGVLGQADFTGGSANRGGAAAANTFDSPYSAALSSSGTLFVADAANARVLRFDSAASKANGDNADGVLGQPNFTSTGTGTSSTTMKNNVTGVSLDSQGGLYVTDKGNHRILYFANGAGKANGAAADNVLGQADFTSSGTALTATGVNQPVISVFDDYSGRLWVPDLTNKRVIGYYDSTLVLWTTLTVSKAGSGSGTVTGSDSNISCGNTCSANYTQIGTTVTLTATADSGSTFVSWTGCDSTSGNTCTVTITNQGLTLGVTATFSSGYTITASSDTGGSISPSGQAHVAYGGSQTFTITPVSGNLIDTALVDGSAVTLSAQSSAVKAITVRGDSSSYTFSNVTADHTISASFKPRLDDMQTVQITGAGSSVSLGVMVDDSSVVFTKLETQATPEGVPPAVQAAADSGLPVMTFTLVNVPAYVTQKVSFLLPEGKNADRVFKYGKTPSDPTDHWYEFPACGAAPCVSFEKAELRTRVTLHLIDGALGDSDLTVNGQINDPVSFAYIGATDTGLPDGATSITVKPASGGSVTPSGTKAYQVGEKAVYHITPETGFHIGDVKVDGKSVGAVPQLILTVTSGSHTIEAVFENGGITVNGSRAAAVRVKQGEPVKLDVSFNNRGLAGLGIDLWIAALTPAGWMYYDLADNTWKTGLRSSYQGPAQTVNTLTVYNGGGLPAGNYTLYCGYDRVANGSVDGNGLNYDRVNITVE